MDPEEDNTRVLCLESCLDVCICGQAQVAVDSGQLHLCCQLHLILLSFT